MNSQHSKSSQEQSRQRLRRFSPIGIFAAVIFLSLLSFRRDFFGDPGAGWHLLSGLGWFAGAPVVAPDPFSFGSTDKIWIADQWLGDMIFGVVFHLLGFRGLELLCAVIITLAYIYLPGRKVGRTVNDLVALVIAILICSALGSVQWFFRPVIFSFLCLSYLLYLVSPSVTAPRVTAENRAPRPLVRPVQIAVLFVLWCNLHPGFFIGLVYLCFRLFDRRAPRPGESATAVPAVSSRVLDLGVAFFSTGINPFGFRLHLSAMELARSSYFTHLNEEWLPPQLLSSPFWLIIPAAIVIALSVLMRDRSSVARSDLALSLLLLCLATQQRRYAPIAGIASIRPLTLSLSELLVRLGRPARLILRIGTRLAEMERQTRRDWSFPATLIAAFLLTTGFWIDPGEDGPLRFGRYGFSAQLRQAVKENSANCGSKPEDGKDQSPALVGDRATIHPPCRIFASPDYGGLLIWWLYLEPGIQVFIDDRNQLYGQSRYEQYFATAFAKPGWDERLRNWGIDMVYFYGPSPLRAAIEETEGWRQFYSAENGAAALYQRTEAGSGSGEPNPVLWSGDKGKR